MVPKEIWYGVTDWHTTKQWFLKAYDIDKGAWRDFALKDFGEPVEFPDKFFQAIGWTHAQCCVWLDEGKDPRTEETSQLVPMAIKDFTREVEQ